MIYNYFDTGKNEMRYLAVAFSLIFAIVAFTFMPSVIDSFHTTITDEITDTGNVTTGGGETAGNMTLTEDLYMDRLGSIISLTSSYGSDDPVASAYDAETNELDIDGLAASQSRIITAVYEYDTSSEFPNARQLVQVGPTIVILSLIVLVIAIPLGLIFIAYRRLRGQ